MTGVAPVVWTGRSGEEVETVIAVLLSRRYPMAERITASRGDGGIDVQVPNGDGWDIYQIKNFTTRFRKAHVERSFERLIAYTSEAGIMVASWNLLMPMNPSKEARIFLTKLTKAASFPCVWPGKIYIDGLAAEFPDVVEYYFGDGRERLETLVRQVASFRNTTELGRELGGSPVQPADVEPGLRDIFSALNSHDPHYAYAFEVTPRMPPRDPKCVFQQTSGNDGCFVTYKLYPRYKEALNDRPLTLQTSITVAAGTPEEAAVRDFFEYGAPLDTENIAMSATADVPGGLGGILEGTGARLRIGPPLDHAAERDRVVRLQVVSPDGETVAQVRLRLRPATTGLRRRKVRTVGTDEGDCFDLETRYDNDAQTWQWSFRLKDLTGKHPMRVLPGLQVMEALRPPNYVRITGEYGPAPHDSIPLPQHDNTRSLEPLIQLVQALATIQEYTSVQITMPALDSLRDVDCNAFMRSAGLLRGGVVTQRMHRLECQLDAVPAGAVDGGPQSVTEVVPHMVTIVAETIELGYIQFHAMDVNVAWSQATKRGATMALTPTDGHSFVARFERVRPMPSEQ